jgi:Holliday junction resolvase
VAGWGSGGSLASRRCASPAGPRRPSRRTLAAALGAALVASPAAAREKNDVVVLQNGDHLTGEIKGMSRGKLDLSTDDAGRISIEWVKVARATSAHSYEIDLASGERHFGLLLPPPAGETGVVLIDPETRLPVQDVVAIIPLDAAFWSRLKAYLDAGFTVAKSNRATTLSAAGEVAYRGDRVGTTLGFDAYVQDDENTTTVGRGAVTLSGDYYFTRWRASLLAGAERNDELDLKLRVSLGGGAGYSVLQSNSMQLWATAALIFTREQYATGDATPNLEAYLDGTWEAFRYDSPKLDLGVSFSVYPGLTDLGRVRGALAVRVKYELFTDFNAGLSISYSFDTRPPDPAASKTDYLATFTIGWSYRR